MHYNIDVCARNVLEGRSADGARVLETPVSFTKKDDVRRKFADIAAGIVTAMVHRCLPPLTYDELTGLLFKMAAHCRKSSWQTVETMDNLANLREDIAESILLNRGMLQGSGTLDKMLELYEIERRAATLRMQQAAPPDRPPRKCFDLCDGYSLVELETPHQIFQEGLSLGNCLHTSLNYEAMHVKNVNVTSDARIQYLTHAIKVREKDIRLFSLRDKDDIPCMTLEYDMKRHEISNMETRVTVRNGMSEQRFVKSTDPYFPALCDALTKLGEQILIMFVDRFPLPPAGQYYARDGQLHTWKMNTPTRMVSCMIAADEIDEKTLQRLAKHTDITLDITRLHDKSCLPHDMHASLYAGGNTALLSLPGLKSAGNIIAPHAHIFEAPSLQSARNIRLEWTKKVMLPQLNTAVSIYTPECNDIDIKELRRVGRINVLLNCIIRSNNHIRQELISRGGSAWARG